jgi:tRNA(Ile)-lysidine synthase
MQDNIDLLLTNDCGLVKDRSIIVGVSGGADSLCLMETLRRAGYPVIVAHFDHQLRAESSRDADMVEQTAARLNLEFLVDHADVKVYSVIEKLSVEEAARKLRYKFLFGLARKRGSQAVAVGHTADDQVETILMHLLRGSGLSGLKGMSFRTIIKSFDPDIPLIRPLLNVWREETIRFCKDHELATQRDPSNDSLEYKRNRIRHSLIPVLESYNPKFREVLARTSQSLQGDHAIVAEAVDNAWQKTTSILDQDVVIIKADLFRGYSIGLQRNLIKRVMQALRPDVDVDFGVLERAVILINQNGGPSQIELTAGLCLLREGNSIYIFTSTKDLPFNHFPQLPDAKSIHISIPGKFDLAGGWKLICERRYLLEHELQQIEQNDNPFQTWLAAENLSEILELRVRHQGDHFKPLGLGGHSQKLSDFFVNEKVPKRMREHWPILCKEDEIVWVPGYRPAHDYRLEPETQEAVYFCLTRPNA